MHSTFKNEDLDRMFPRVKMFYRFLQHPFKTNSPSFNSPKFPHPIFFPTRKLGPTMRTPEELEEPDALGCPLRLPWGTLVLLAGRSPYLSLCWSMAGAAHISARLDWCRIRPPGPGQPQPQPWSLAALWRRSHCHGPELGAVYQHGFFSTPRFPYCLWRLPLPQHLTRTNVEDLQ